MAGFLYFAPVSIAPTLDRVREWGLGYAFSREPITREAQGDVPGGSRGFCFAGRQRTVLYGEPQIRMAEQVWRKMPGRDGQQEVWVGYWKQSKPTPADLARAEMLAGYELTMADGNKWQIPVVRAFDADCGKAVPLLPTLYDLDDSGQLTKGEIAAAHRWLWDLTEPAWQAMVKGDGLTDQSLLAMASKLIGANYAVDVVELAAMLQVFSPQLSPSGIVALAIDYTTWKEWANAKKKTPSPPTTDDGSSSINGETASLLDTDQPALTS